jgi:signal transduction histidine kinase
MRQAMGSRSGAPNRGPAIVIALLVLAVLVTGAMSFEAVRAARAARATAEGVLRDYASIAAIQFGREVQARLDPLLSQGISAARHAAQQHATAPDRAARSCDCGPPKGTRTLFAVGGTGLTFVEGDAMPAGLADELAADGGAEAPVLRPRLRLLSDHSVAVTAPVRGPGEPITVGFVAGPAFLLDVFTCVMRDAALLPHSLVDPAATRDVVTLRVHGPAGGELFRSGDAWSSFARDAAFAENLGGLRASAAIAPERASMLLIGGLPSDRWPLVAGLLVLAVGLVTAAAVQVRREIRFARARADFVSGVSHELRTPLAQIRLFGETLLLGRVRSPAEAQRAAGVIVQEARRLGQMVDNVLLFSRAGRGVATLSREPVDIGRLVRDVIESFRQQAASRLSTLEWRMPAGELVVHADPNAVRQVLLNLLDNAMKYGRRGQTVIVELAVEDPIVRLAVDDEGSGIAAQDQSRIWQPFWRAPGSAEGGTGLGLAIVRDLVDRHGGTAGVEHGRRGGARFVVTFDAPVVEGRPSATHLSA